MWSARVILKIVIFFNSQGLYQYFHLFLTFSTICNSTGTIRDKSMSVRRQDERSYPAVIRLDPSAFKTVFPKRTYKRLGLFYNITSIMIIKLNEKTNTVLRVYVDNIIYSIFETLFKHFTLELRKNSSDCFSSRVPSILFSSLPKVHIVVENARNRVIYANNPTRCVSTHML